ncbi:MAG: hypothetical protein ACLFQJ_01345 [Campylobacterales bacterium]
MLYYVDISLDMSCLFIKTAVATRQGSYIITLMIDETPLAKATASLSF